MIKHLLFILICFSYPVASVYADTMIVKVPVLNVRTCPSTDCNIVKKLSKGGKVNTLEITNGWAKINIEKDKTGYAISRSLRNSYSYLWWYAVIGIAICAFLSVLYDKAKNKCPNCKKWGALQEADRECIEKLKSNIKKVATTRYKDHTTRREYFVPATVYKYKITKICSNCGKVVTLIESKKLEN